jgi:hypothetical protein
MGSTEQGLEALWIPGPTLRSHTGSPVRPNAVFFAAPPKEIGDITSCYSNHENNKSLSQKLKDVPLEMWLLPGFAFVVVGFIVFFLFRAVLGSVGLATILGLVSGLGTSLFLLNKIMISKCSYVGTLGFAEFFWHADPATRTQPSM